MDLIYHNYTREEFDEEGVLSKIEFFPTENFNFAYDVVDVLAEKCPDKMAMYWLSRDKEEKKFSFSDMSRKSSQTAHYFASLGIGKGDVVMLILRRNYQFWYSMLALHKLGAIVIPATNQLMEKDLIYRFQVAKVKAIVCTSMGDIAEHVDAALPESPTVTVRSIVGEPREGWSYFDDEIEKFPTDFPRVQNSKDDPMLMFFTSGTTGYPKLAAHSFTYPLGHIVTARHWHNVNPDGIHFTISDTGWGKAVWGKLYGQWLCEACIFTYDFDRFHADDILRLFAKYKITTFCAPPTMYRFFVQENLDDYDLSSLEYATTAGEALNPEVFKRFYESTGIKLMEGFGQTETTLTLANLVGSTPKPGSMGRPSPQYRIALMLPDGKLAHTGQIGEIVLPTDQGVSIGMFMGYYLDEVRTKEVWYDGYYHTGDTAWQDEDGFLWFVGRTDDIIKSSGYRIGPFEIESVLMEHPAVTECAVTAVPDPIRGQAVKATIVLSKGYQPSDELAKEIQDFVKNLTAPYKYPRVVEFVEELPKTISGKIRRVDIREK